MPEVFEEHKKIINANRVQYENSLKVLLNWLQLNLFSFIFLQSTPFKTDIYMSEAGTNIIVCLRALSIRQNWLARPKSFQSDNFTFNQNYPTRSVKSLLGLVCREEMVF